MFKSQIVSLLTLQIHCIILISEDFEVESAQYAHEQKRQHLFFENQKKK